MTKPLVWPRFKPSLTKNEVVNFKIFDLGIERFEMIGNIFTFNVLVLHGEVGPLDALGGVSDVLEAKAGWLFVVLFRGKNFDVLEAKARWLFVILPGGDILDVI